jgi:hypothetical protein
MLHSLHLSLRRTIRLERECTMTGLYQRMFPLNTASLKLHPCRIHTIQRVQMCTSPDLHLLRMFPLHTVSPKSHQVLLHTILQEK